MFKNGILFQFLRLSFSKKISRSEAFILILCHLRALLVCKWLLDANINFFKMEIRGLNTGWGIQRRIWDDIHKCLAWYSSWFVTLFELLLLFLIKTSITVCGNCLSHIKRRFDTQIVVFQNEFLIFACVNILHRLLIYWVIDLVPA